MLCGQRYACLRRERSEKDLQSPTLKRVHVSALTPPVSHHASTSSVPSAPCFPRWYLDPRYIRDLRLVVCMDSLCHDNHPVAGHLRWQLSRQDVHGVHGVFGNSFWIFPQYRAGMGRHLVGCFVLGPVMRSCIPLPSTLERFPCSFVPLFLCSLVPFVPSSLLPFFPSSLLPFSPS